MEVILESAAFVLGVGLVPVALVLALVWTIAGSTAANERGFDDRDDDPPGGGGYRRRPHVPRPGPHGTPVRRARDDRRPALRDRGRERRERVRIR